MFDYSYGDFTGFWLCYFSWAKQSDLVGVADLNVYELDCVECLCLIGYIIPYGAEYLFYFIFFYGAEY